MAASSILQFKNSTPQSMKNKKLYDDDNKFTDNDLQDVLDGLVKLKMSNNHSFKTTNNQSNKPLLTHQPSISPLPRPQPYLTPQHSNMSNTPNTINTYTATPNTISTNTITPNRHTPSYQQEPTFIASSRTYHKQIAGINLLYEAAKKVEGKSHFKIDIADIDRVTRKIDDIKDNDLIYNNQTGIMKKKSKNGISPPEIHNINELMDNPNNISAFSDLNDDFTPVSKRESSFGVIKQQLRFSDMNSIGRRSSILGRSSLLNSPNKLSMDEQQLENKRLSREYSDTNIREMDKIFLDKTKLELNDNKKQLNDTMSNDTSINELKKPCKQICKEFSDSNITLLENVNNYKENINKVIDRHKQTRSQPREQFNQMLMKQLNDMEIKIAKQKINDRKREEEERKRQQDEIDRKNRILQQQQQQQQQPPPPPQQQPQAPVQVQPPIQSQPQQQQQVQTQTQAQGQIESKSEWYPHQKELEQIYSHYKQTYKQFELLIEKMEKENSNIQMFLETKIGLIVRSISANRKSVFEAYQRFKTLINTKTQPNSIERHYSFIEITQLIVSDIRIVKSSAQKFASSYFLSFIMNEYCAEYFEIFKCIFYHYCIWTIPYIGGNLRALQNNNIPSIPRCFKLGYHQIKDINMVPKDKQKYLQRFSKTNNAGTQIFESETKYFTRMQHICGLFAAFMSIRNGSQFKNPFGIDSGHCWQWIAYLLGLPKCIYPELCCILSGIIPIVGEDMLKKYPKQFPKIIKCIKFNIHSQCMSDTSARGKAKRELNLFLKEYVENNGKINKPKESKLIEKTVGALALTQQY